LRPLLWRALAPLEFLVPSAEAECIPRRILHSELALKLSTSPRDKLYALCIGSVDGYHTRNGNPVHYRDYLSRKSEEFIDHRIGRERLADVITAEVGFGEAVHRRIIGQE